MWEHMTEQQYQHEVIVPDKGFPFKLFYSRDTAEKYIREKHWHRSIEIFAVQEGELDFILDTTHYHLGEGEFIIVNSNEVACDPCEQAESHNCAADSAESVRVVLYGRAVYLVFA